MWCAETGGVGWDRCIGLSGHQLLGDEQLCCAALNFCVVLSLLLFSLPFMSYVFILAYEFYLFPSSLHRPSEGND